MGLTVVNVAYPLAPVRADAVGGAEQIVHLLDRALVERGHRSIVIACDGSTAHGRLVKVPREGGRLDPAAVARAAENHRRAVREVLAGDAPDVLHFHGHDFDRYLPSVPVPVLATLHLPPELATARLDEINRPATWLHGVSPAQHRRLPVLPNLLPPIENGIRTEELPRRLVRRRFAVAMGRICPEKGFHLALKAAKRANTPLVLGGQVFPYDAHVRYFERELRPCLDRDRRFVGPLSIGARCRLLNAARCLLVTSVISETSSLVAMEALACGTPVIAFPSGVLPDIVEHGVTGFIVSNVDEMAEAIGRADAIDPDRCRQSARTRFSAARMIDSYIARYEWIVAQGLT